MLDASVSLAWFLKETPERAAYAAAVNALAAEGAGKRPFLDFAYRQKRLYDQVS
jgi:hypothetical protein